MKTALGLLLTLALLFHTGLFTCGNTKKKVAYAFTNNANADPN